MNNRWKVFAALAAGALLLWFITFVVEWHIRTGWQQNWADGAIRAWSNFSMLHWVDTTFATGVLAIVAASTVFINGYIERAARWREVQAIHLSQILGTIGQIDLALRRLAHELATRKRVDHFERLTGEIEALCQKLTSDVTPLAHIVMFAVSRVKEVAFQAGDSIDARPGPGRQMSVLLWGAIYAINAPDRFFEKGTGRYLPNIKTLASAEQRKNFDATVLDNYDRGRFSEWLNWD